MSDEILEVLNEDGNQNTIIKSSGKIYAHLMKFTVIRPRESGWIVTVVNQIGILSDVKDKFWREFNKDDGSKQKRYDDIRKEAIKVFKHDNEESGNFKYLRDNIPEKAFDIVFSYFPDPNEFRRYYPAKVYMYQVADNEKDYDAIDLLDNNKTFKNVTVKD